MTFRYTQPTSSNSGGRRRRGWTIIVLVVLGILATLGLLGYFVAGGEDVLSYRYWRLQRSQRTLLRHVQTLQAVHADMVETMEMPTLSLAEANDRFVRMDRELQQVAKSVQEMDIPPALSGHVRQVNDTLLLFGESMTLLQQTLVDPDPMVQASLSSRLRRIDSELTKLHDQLEIVPKTKTGKEVNSTPDSVRWVVFLPVVLASTRSSP